MDGKIVCVVAASFSLIILSFLLNDDFAENGRCSLHSNRRLMVHFGWNLPPRRVPRLANGVRGDASIRQLESQVLLGRAAGKQSELANHVRLVEVTAIKRKFDPVRLIALTDPLDRTLEPEDSSEKLGRLAELIAAMCDQVLMAPAEISGQAADFQPSACLLHQPPGSLDFASWRLHGGDSADNEPFEHGKPSVPVAGLGESLNSGCLIELLKPAHSNLRLCYNASDHGVCKLVTANPRHCCREKVIV